MAKKKPDSSILSQYKGFKKSYSKKAIAELDTLSPKQFADKYFAGLKNRKSAQGKVRRLKQGKDLVEGTHIIKKKQRIVTHFHKITKNRIHHYTKNYVTKYWKIKETSFNSDNSLQFQFMEYENDTTNVMLTVYTNQDTLEKVFDKIPKKSKKFQFIKLRFSIDYTISFLDKSSGVWFSEDDIFEISYAIYYKNNIDKALKDIEKSLNEYFHQTDSISFLIHSPIHFYEKAILK